MAGQGPLHQGGSETFIGDDRRQKRWYDPSGCARHVVKSGQEVVKHGMMSGFATALEKMILHCYRQCIDPRLDESQQTELRVYSDTST